MSAHDRACFTDFALQEHAQGRLDQAVRREVAAHTQDCADCRLALQAFEAEAALLREALKSLRVNGEGAELTDETLALYSGGALPSDEAARVESILSNDAEALQRLIRLIGETRFVRTDTPVDFAEPLQPSGEILRMPKRLTPPATVDVSRRASGGHSA